jgi:hypothetical protein
VSGRDDETAAGSNANPRMLAMAGAAADTPLDAVSARLITTAGRQHWPTVIMATIEPSRARPARARRRAARRPRRRAARRGGGGGGAPSQQAFAAAASFHPKTHTPLMRPNVLRMALDADSPSLGCRLATSWPSMIELLGYSGQFE